MSKRILRLLVTTECNADCSYCCNKIPEVKSTFRYQYLDDIDFTQYEDVCITGGEPLLYLGTIAKVCKIAVTNNVYLYTNGTMLGYGVARYLSGLGIKGITVGLHTGTVYDTLESLMDFPTLKEIRIKITNELANRTDQTILLALECRGATLIKYDPEACPLQEGEDRIVLLPGKSVRRIRFNFRSV